MPAFWMIVSCLLFACMGVCVKLAADTFSTGETVFWRGLVSMLMMAALGDGSADVITAYSSDGTIAGNDLLLITDDRAALPAYDALLLVAPGRDALARRLARYDGRIPVEAMREANWLADRPEDKRSPAEAARWLKAKTGL